MHKCIKSLWEVLEKYTEGPDSGVFTDGSAIPNPGPGGWGVLLLSGDDLATGKFWIITGAAGEGSLMTFPPDPAKFKPGRGVAADMKKRGFKPEMHALRTYAAIQVWAKADSFELKKMTKVLATNIYRTVLGKITFDNKGDMKQDAYVWYEWSKGKYAMKVFREKIEQ